MTKTWLQGQVSALPAYGGQFFHYLLSKHLSVIYVQGLGSLLAYHE